MRAICFIFVQIVLHAIILTGIDPAFCAAPSPEGGYYKETYRSKESIGKNALPGSFLPATVIFNRYLFLLEEGNFPPCIAFNPMNSGILRR